MAKTKAKAKSKSKSTPKVSRPIWRGDISFGLVSVPVQLFSAERRSDLNFHLLDNRDHARIHYERINDSTGEEVPWNDVVKAYEYSKGHYVVLEDKDFKRAAVESSENIEIEAFVPQKDIDYMYFDKPYYLVPDKKGEKGYVLLRDTLKQTKKVGIAKVAIRTRQYLAALMAVGDSLVLNLLRFSNELRQQSEFEVPTKKTKVSAKEAEIAQQLVNAMSTKWNPNQYHDDYREALLKIIEKKEKGIPIKEPPKAEKPSAKVIDFMALLKKSVEEQKGKKRKAG